jgi:hypothetical protein
MNFLEKFLAVVLKIGQVAVGIEPVIAQAVPQAGTPMHAVIDDLTAVATLVQNGTAVVAALKQNLTPDQEAAAIAPLVAQALLKAEILAGKKVHDEAGFAAASAQIAAGVKGVLLSVE